MVIARGNVSRPERSWWSTARGFARTLSVALLPRLVLAVL